MATYRHSYKVEGSGAFPTDMLRYDQSYPRTSDDVAGIETDPYTRGRQGHRAVNLSHVGDSKVWSPTMARWSSFLWNVTEIGAGERIDR